MNDANACTSLILRRFFEKFHALTYHGVSVSRYIYYRFYGSFLVHRWNLDWVKKNSPSLQEEIGKMADCDVFHCLEEPYPYDPHPDGVILIRDDLGGFAASCLPQESFFIISPTQAKAEAAQKSLPDIAVHNFEEYYRANPAAVHSLNDQVVQIVNAQKDDPIFGSSDLLEWLTGKMPEIVRELDAARLLFEILDVSVVLSVTALSGMDSALTLIAKSNRIPSLTLQHGLIADTSLFAHIPLQATQKAVWGEMTRDWYQRLGYPESRIVVTGSPRYDIIFHRQWWGQKKLRQMVGAGPNQKIMVFATGTDTPTIIPLVLEGLKALPEVFLIISLHRREGPIDLYKKLAVGYCNYIIIPFGEINLYDSLSGADFFITHCSTAALEAMLFKIPVITMESTPPHFSYGDAGASIRVRHASELARVVRRLIDDQEFRADAINRYREFLAAYCLTDDLAGKRFFEKAEQIRRSGGSV